jgi:hypothetical protein
LHDALMIEERGTPATVLITEPFQMIIASHAAKLGAPGYHSAAVPHPVYGKTDPELRALAAGIVTQVVAQVAPNQRGPASSDPT